MMAEDWSGGALSYPNCEGFRETPTDHYMKPFQIQTENIYKDDPQVNRGIMFNDSCREAHTYIMDYLKSFIKAYPDKPKFSISWMISLGHDHQNALSSSDDFFYQFFKDNQKEFDNSFIFFMGDHGLRFGKVRETLVGEIEDNNPLLFLSVPKTLRTKKPRIVDPLIYGSSIFHPLSYPRTCDSLRIPFEYCICRAQKTLIPKNNNTVGIPAAKLMIDQINSELSASDETSNICSKLSLNDTAEIIVEDFGGEQSVRIYKITFSTIPGNAKFWGVISFDPTNPEKLQIISTKFLRLNAYGSQAECAKKSDLASYCFCI
uniref:Uncharacterized protein n=1 Tax=Panagrolaimus superbus TaxID=310955 RepID=A0A914ZAL5_9BILA